MILILDFGSQTTHLIGRRLRDLGIKKEIWDSDSPFSRIKKRHPAGIILSGGPDSVYGKKGPKISPKVFDLGIPILGICYGWQLAAHLLKGKVVAGHQEYGPSRLKVKNLKLGITQGLPRTFTVWLSHGDTVVKLPKRFQILGSTAAVESALVADLKKNLYGLQFHPEVEHTQYGQRLLQNFAENVCHLKIKKRKIRINQMISRIKKEVGSAGVIGAVSGGIDSTVAAVLIARAVGPQLIPVYIESGLMRIGTLDEINDLFKKRLKITPVVVEAQNLFLKKLKGVADPEEKRKIIGELYIRLFEKEARKMKGIKFLAQGTIYSDVIESKGTKNAAMIKSHHNVGGLPNKLGLKLIEPLRFYYKDEVKKIGRRLGLPQTVVKKQPFPGPGQAIRIVGEITRLRLAKQQQADKIILEEIYKAGWEKKVFQSFPIMTGAKSTAVKGDSRFYGEVIGLRVYDSSDIMTASWSQLPYSLLQKISSRIVNEIPDISRVVYDITTKPPATMEWE